MADRLGKLKGKIQEELAAAERELKVELPREIKKALELGDLTENAEYKSALERQQFLKARMGQLRQRLEELAMLNIERLPLDRAAFGSRLQVMDLDAGEEKTFTLVMPEESDLKQGLVSLASPLGRGFLGKREGDEVTVQTPGGRRRFEILELRTLHQQPE